MIKASIYKPITMLMVILTVVVFGLYTYSMMVVDLMPKFDVPVVTATIIYQGASPEEIESTIIKPIEDQVELVDGIDFVQSICLENYGILVAMFNMGVNVDVAANDVRSKIDLASVNFPDAVQASRLWMMTLSSSARRSASSNGGIWRLGERHIQSNSPLIGFVPEVSMNISRPRAWSSRVSGPKG